MSDLGLPEELVEGDLKSLSNCSNGEETWLDRFLTLKAGQRCYGDAGFLGEPFTRPIASFPKRPHPPGEFSGVVVGTH